MVSTGRHPKPPIAKALAAVAREGLRVDPVHNKGHRWGVLICTSCGDSLSIWSTPKDPDVTAKIIRRFERNHRHEENR